MTDLDRMLINGTWKSASDGATLEVRNPATEHVVGSVPAATPADVRTAAEAAAAAWQTWRHEDPWQKTAILRTAAAAALSAAGTLAGILTEEQGKPLGEAGAEVRAAAEILDWCADEARRVYGRTVPSRSRDYRTLVIREPVGPVAALTAGNFPALLPARKLGAALGAGCSVVLKPAEATPRSALFLAALLQDAGLPAGVLNVVTGDPAMISRELMASRHIRKVSLTGSVEVGRQLLALAAHGIKPSTMELGGHAAALVFPDADLDLAADAIVRAKFRNCGQVCITVSRLLAHQDISDDLVALVTAKTRALTVGCGTDQSAQVGPLASARAVRHVEALVDDARARGAVIETGGGRPPNLARGYFYEPTVLSGVPAHARMMREEPFGPVLPVNNFSSMDDGIAQANATEYGLSGFVFTRDLATATRVAEGLEAGMVGVNRTVIATAEAPAGGVKASGFGREGGSEALENYTTSKYISLGLGL